LTFWISTTTLNQTEAKNNNFYFLNYKEILDSSALFSYWSFLYLTFVCLFRSAAIIVVELSIIKTTNLIMENTSGISEETPSSTPSIDEKDLVVSMRKLDLIKELGFVMINNLKNIKF